MALLETRQPAPKPKSYWVKRASLEVTGLKLWYCDIGIVIDIGSLAMALENCAWVTDPVQAQLPSRNPRARASASAETPSLLPLEMHAGIEKLNLDLA